MVHLALTELVSLEQSIKEYERKAAMEEELRAMEEPQMRASHIDITSQQKVYWSEMGLQSEGNIKWRSCKLQG